MRQDYVTDDPRPAPGALALVQDFANAHFAEARQPGRERAPEGIAAWLRRHGLVSGTLRLSPAERDSLLALRTAVRDLIGANDGGPLPPRSVRTLNEAAARGSLAVEFGRDGTAEVVAANGGVDGAIATLVSVIAAAQADGTWERMKLCRADDCRWAYYDSSKNRSGAWCSMSDCGNRAKARAYRERHGS